jgi:hypothetical protein
MSGVPSRFQFSIRLLLIVTAAVAAAVGAVVAEPSWQSCLALEFVAVLFASIAVVAAFKSKGVFRVFWVAAAVPTSAATGTYFVYGCLATASSMMIDPAEALVMATSGLRVALPVLWCLSLANGLLCGLVYRAVWSGG